MPRIWELFASWTNEPERNPFQVHLLNMKSNMKELDPKAFSEKEKRAFDATDMEEWKQSLADGSLAVVPANEESKNIRDLMFTTPMRLS